MASKCLVAFKRSPGNRYYPQIVAAYKAGGAPQAIREADVLLVDLETDRAELLGQLNISEAAYDQARATEAQGSGGAGAPSPAPVAGPAAAGGATTTQETSDGQGQRQGRRQEGLLNRGAGSPGPARRRPNIRAINEEKDDILAAIAKLGGINIEEAEADGIDFGTGQKTKGGAPKRRVYRAGILPVFSRGGQSMDGMAEALAGYYYPVVDARGDYSGNMLLSQIQAALRGERIMSMAGGDAAMQQMAGEDPYRPDDYLVDDPDFGPLSPVADELAGMLDEQAVEPTAVDLDDIRLRAEAVLGETRVEDLLERLASRMEDATADEFALAARQALEDEINVRSAQDAGRVNGPDQRSQAPGNGEGVGAPLLSDYTEADIRAREDAAAAQARGQVEADRRAAADAERGGFTLTGPDRPVDELEARGQGALFSRRAPAEFRAPEVRDAQGRLLAPNGRPSKLNERQWHQVRSPEFQAWFGDWERDPENASKVVDENGEPLVVYHGTKADVSAFDRGRAGASDPGVLGPAFYFAPSADQAGAFAMSASYGRGDAPNVMPVFLVVRRPVMIADGRLPDGDSLADLHGGALTKRSGDKVQKRMQREGYDGGLFTVGGEITQLVAFRPEQVKSAIGNAGTYDPTNPDIRASRQAPPVRPSDYRNQADWLTAEAQARGYPSLDDMLNQAPDEAMGLMEQWRQEHPAAPAPVGQSVASLRAALERRLGGFRVRALEQSGLLRLVQSVADLPRFALVQYSRNLSDYGMEHRPMTREGGAAALHDLAHAFGEDIYGRHALQYFGTGDQRETEALRVMRQVRGRPDAMVTIYRGAPQDAEGINVGDWVTLSRSAAQDYADQHPGGQVLEMKVPARDITSWPDSLLEFGYYPEAGDAQYSKAPYGDAQGVWDGSQLWLVADNIDPGDELGVALHEGKHAGERLFVGQAWEQLQAEFDRLLEANDPAATSALERVPGGISVEDARAERLAYFVEEAQTRLDAAWEGAPLSEKARLLYRRIIAGLRAWVAASPFWKAAAGKYVGLRLTDELAVALARQSLMAAQRARVAAQRGTVGGEPAAQFSRADLLERLAKIKFIPARDVLRILGEFPQYLNDVVDFMVQQRARLVRGQMTARDVAKAWFITVSSQGSDAKSAAMIEAKTGFRVPEEFQDDRGFVRPEEAAAAWLFSPMGQRALDAAERGEFDAEAWAEGGAVRQAYGDDRLGNAGLWGTSKAKRTFLDLAEITREINASRGNSAKVAQVVSNMAGIGLGKTGFVKHLLGIGDAPTIDAVEINTWVTGQGSTAALTRAGDPKADLAKWVTSAIQDPAAGRVVEERIKNRFRELRAVNADAKSLDPAVFQHVMHHWLWDRAKGTETTHASMYRAMQQASRRQAPEPKNAITEGDSRRAPAPRWQRRPDFDAFRAWFGYSKVRHVVYHATAADFDAFDTTRGDLGAHFGTAEQANYLKGRLEGRGSIQIMPVWLSIQNPLRLQDTGTFHADGIAMQLERKGLLPRGEGKRIEQEIARDWEKRLIYDPQMRQVIRDAGYDGVVYKNGHEGAGDSWIAFEPTQVKSAIGNVGTYDGADPRIQYSRRRPTPPGGPQQGPQQPQGAAPQPTQPTPPPRAAKRRAAPLRAWDATFGTVLDKVSAQIVKALAKVELVSTAPPELHAAIRKMRIAVGKAQRDATGWAELGGQISLAERELLSDILEGSLAQGVVPPQHLVRLGTAIRAAMDRQSDDLLDLGGITQETYDRYRGIYLPRFYRQHLQDKLSKELAEMFQLRSTRAGVSGGHLKGRGIWEAVPASEASTWEALGWEQRGEATQGAKAEALRKIAKDAPGEVARYGQEDFVFMWRDYTREERERMGEVRDAIYRAAKGYLETQRDIGMLRLFESIAADPRLASDTEVPGWTHIPDSKVTDTPGVRRYGKLAGKWVEPGVNAELNWLTGDAWPEFMRPWLRAQSLWKAGKVTYNPASHMNNVVSNFFALHFGGVPLWNGGAYLRARQSLKTQDQFYQEAVDSGLLGTDFHSSEILTDLFDSYAMAQQATQGHATVLEKLGRAATKYTGWDAYSKFMSEWYSAEDAFFKLVLFIDRRRAGDSIEEAVAHTEEYVFDYTTLPRGARRVRDTVLPFFSYTHKALGMFYKTLRENPHRLLAPGALLGGINFIAYAMLAGADADEEEDKERRILPRWMAGNSALPDPVGRGALPKNIRLPVGQDGQATYLDVYRWLPLGDMFDTENQAGGIAWPAPFMPGNPALTLFTGLFFGKDSWFGRDIVDQYGKDVDGKMTWAGYKQMGRWVAQQVLPNAPVVPGGYGFNRLMEGIASATETPIDLGVVEYTGTKKDGSSYSLPEALAHTVGVKVRTLDLDEEAAKRARELGYRAREAKADMRRAAKDRSLSAEARAKRMAESRADLDEVNRRMRELGGER